MKSKLFVAALAVAALLTFNSTLVRAAVMQWTFEGTVASGIDVTGIFAPVGTNLAGTSFVSHFIFDTSLGTHNFVPNQQDQVFGGTIIPNTSPSLGASLTINGNTYFLAGDFLGNFNTTCNPPCLAGSASQVAAAARDTSFAGSVLFDEIFNTGTGSLLQHTLTPFSYSVQPGDITAGEFAFAFDPQTGAAVGTHLFLAESSTSLTASPLPAALPLFAGGLGLIGLLARRRKQRHAAALP